MEAMFDRMDAVGKAVLGLTIQCAQCHNHKFDPLTQEEYYRIFAFLNNSHEANVAVYSAEEQARRAEIFREIESIEDELKHRAPNWQERLAAWESETPESPTGMDGARCRGRWYLRREVSARRRTARSWRRVTHPPITPSS